MNSAGPLPYDEKEIVKKLERISVPARASFAAACGQRQMHGYLSFFAHTGRGDPEELAQILERIWRRIGGDQKVEPELQVDLERCMALIPKEDDGPWVDEQALAEDAASAVAYALRTLATGEAQEAAWAARRAYEALDYYVINRVGFRDDQIVLAHPVVQAELMRQQRDLDELLEAVTDEQRTMAATGNLRTRAQQEANSFLGSGGSDVCPTA